MKHIHTYLTVLLLCVYAGAQAQDAYDGTFGFDDVRITKQAEEVLVDFKLNLTSVSIAKQAKVELTPVLRSNSEGQSLELAPIVIAGKKRDKVIRRELLLQNYSFPVEPYKYVVSEEEQSVMVSMSLPYSEWMRDARLEVAEESTGCAGCLHDNITYDLTGRILPPVFVPSYELQYVMPEAEPVKQRSDSYSAYLNYKVARYELLYDFENNAAELDKVNDIVREIKNDKDLTFQTLSVTGYASPEGNYESNMTLSKNRAYAFVEYLKSAHGLSPSVMQVDWKGEDWAGLRKAVETSGIPDRDAVTGIIDGTYDIAQRKQRLQALNNGATYKYLLHNYYPPLRRNDYTISYVARPFSIDEAKEILKTKPQYLSLNEMFLVANTYPKDSKEFREVFDIAARLYPNDPVISLNMATQEIDGGNINKAIVLLRKTDMPEAYNNLGVAYAKIGEYDKAADCFNRAVNAGNETSKANLEQLELYLKDQ